MDKTIHHILLADDDIDDCIFFKEALKDLHISSMLTTVHNGADLMHFLSENSDNLPGVLFLDQNMPLKTGLECISEIKADHKLKHLPVIIFSTSLDIAVVNLLYEKGAHYYIRKPGEFSKFKKVIHNALSVMAENGTEKPDKDNFILQP